MAPALDLPTIQISVLPIVNSLSLDRIPNIRFNVAKAFEVLSLSLASHPGGPDLVREGIWPGLERLKADKDPDVRFFAEKGWSVAEKVGRGERVEEEVVMMET